MKNLSTLDDKHEFLFNQLPWLANGTLEQSDAEQLKLHVAECDLCREEMASLVHMQRKITEAHKEVPANASDANASFAKMRKRIEEKENASTYSILDVQAIKDSVLRVLEGKPAQRWAISVACGLTAVLIVAQQYSKNIDQPESSTYQVLSTSEPLGGLELFIQLDPDLTGAQQNELLNEIANLESFEPTWSESENNIFQFSFDDSLEASAAAPDAVSKLIASLQEKRGVRNVGLSP